MGKTHTASRKFSHRTPTMGRLIEKGGFGADYVIMTALVLLSKTSNTQVSTYKFRMKQAPRAYATAKMTTLGHGTASVDEPTKNHTSRLAPMTLSGQACRIFLPMERRYSELLPRDNFCQPFARRVRKQARKVTTKRP